MNTKTKPSGGNATTIKKIFSRQTTVWIDIAANPQSVWQVLTDAVHYPSWNSTIVELKGQIALGERIELRSKLAPNRTFKLRVKEFSPPNTLAWGDALGTRVYSLAPNATGGTRFTMTEKIGGPIFPLFARLIPPFDDAFNQFAADLKSAVEKQA